MSAQPSIRLHIESLVVRGLGGLARAPLADAVRVELARLLAGTTDTRPRWTPGYRAHVDGGSIPLAPVAGVASVGAQIAAAVHRGVTDS